MATKIELEQGKQQNRQHKSSPKDIKIICTDVDGTLITPDVKITPRIEAAIRKLKEKGYLLTICTGKSKGPWVNNVKYAFGNMAGVYINGTVVEDDKGHVIYQKTLSDKALRICFEFAKKHNMTIVPYHCDDTYALEHNKYTDVISYHLMEPHPQIIPDLNQLIGHTSINKCCFVAEETDCAKNRPELTKLLEGEAFITRAVEGFLEILPFGANKGNGVKVYLDRLGIDYKQALCIGDGENDLQMLSQAGIAVAMGNGKQHIKDSADFITKDNQNDGWAIAMEQILLS